MILDYYFNRRRGKLSVSYVTKTGGKQIKEYNVSRFKTYIEDPSGKYTNWNGKPCKMAYTDSPTKLDLLNFLRELPPSEQALVHAKYNPKMYVFDIEVEVNKEEFPHPSQAKYPIYTISVVSPELHTMVLGTRPLEDSEALQKQFDEWISSSEYFKKMNSQRGCASPSAQPPTPSFRYIQFDSERDMLEFFLGDVVSKVPVLGGWNSIGFDWQYIVNRCKLYYPDIRFSKCSVDGSMSRMRYVDLRDGNIDLPCPNHTWILDMMDIIGQFDMMVMPQKESLSLDYIASESPVRANKIKYDGDLQDLYNSDYTKYVFYNAIDSVLVQMISHCFGTLNSLYSQALYCGIKASASQSKIQLSEALFFNYFFARGIKVVPPPRFGGERGELVGAYVRQPSPGKHLFVTCNDFASLYPSTIITCNLSIENYLGSTGEGVFTEKDLEDFRKDPNYFVSVNGSVYKNDQEYAFKAIQKQLKANRNVGKYLGKELEATVLDDVIHLMEGHTPKEQKYSERVVEDLKKLGLNITCTADIDVKNLPEIRSILEDEVLYYSSYEQACKLLGNSMYGGSSHVAFAWFNMQLANDITGEARNLIHKMEKEVPEWFEKNWKEATWLHEKLGIKLKNEL